MNQKQLGRWNKLIRNFRGNKAWDSRVNEFVIACKQALLFGRAKQAARERASERQTLFPTPRFCVSSRVPLVRPLFTISPNGEFSRRLSLSGYFSREKSNLRRSHSSEYFESQNSHDRASSVRLPKKLSTILKCEKLIHLLSGSNVLSTNLNVVTFASFVGYTFRHLTQKRKFIHRPALSC